MVMIVDGSPDHHWAHDRVGMGDGTTKKLEFKDSQKIKLNVFFVVTRSRQLLFNRFEDREIDRNNS